MNEKRPCQGPFFILRNEKNSTFAPIKCCQLSWFRALSAQAKKGSKDILITIRVVSSVGLEHYLDRVGVTGSNPVQPTKENHP